MNRTHLEEVLAGADEGQLSTGTVRLSLAASDSLDQLRDLLGNHLHTHTHSISSAWLSWLQTWRVTCQ